VAFDFDVLSNLHSKAGDNKDAILLIDISCCPAWVNERLLVLKKSGEMLGCSHK